MKRILLIACIFSLVAIATSAVPALAVNQKVTMTVDWNGLDRYDLNAYVLFYDSNWNPLGSMELVPNPEWTIWQNEYVNLPLGAVVFKIVFDDSQYRWYYPSLTPFPFYAGTPFTVVNYCW